MAKPEATQADRDLCDAVRRLGREVTVRQLQTFRAQRLLEQTRTALGRGKGSTVSYPGGSAERVVAILTGLDADRNFDHAALSLWADGHPVPEERVRRALHQIIDGLRRAFAALPEAITDETANNADAQRIATDMASTRSGKRQLRNARKHQAPEEEGTSDAALMRSILEIEIDSIVHGAVPTKGGAVEAVASLGLDPSALSTVGVDVGAPFGVSLDLVAQLADDYPLDVLRSIVEQERLRRRVAVMYQVLVERLGRPDRDPANLAVIELLFNSRPLPLHPVACALHDAAVAVKNKSTPVDESLGAALTELESTWAQAIIGSDS